MSWEQRYSSTKIPCTFCGGSNHWLHTAKDWSRETRTDLGLPRPFVNIKPEHRRRGLRGVLRAKVPIPWSTNPERGPAGADDNTPLPVRSREKDAIKNLKCSMCGIPFDPLESAIRWKSTGPTVGETDNQPFHEACMRQTRIFCPHMQNKDDSEFEKGPANILAANAQRDWKNWNKNWKKK